MTYYVGNHPMQLGRQTPHKRRDDVKKQKEKVEAKPSAYEEEQQTEERPRKQG
jgi:hypothetical protein